MTKWIACYSLVFCILSSVGKADVFDIIEQSSAFTPKTSFPTYVVYVKNGPSEKSQNLNVLISGASIRRLEEKGGWSRVEYRYIGRDPECLSLKFGWNSSVRDKLEKTYSQALKSGSNESVTRASMRGVLRDGGVAEDCYQGGEGWVKSENLEAKEVNTAPKTEACIDCAEKARDGEMKGAITRQKEVAKEIVKKTETKFANKSKDCKPVEGIQVANSLKGNERACKNALNSFYKRCSPWSYMDDDPKRLAEGKVSLKRIAEVERLSENVEKNLRPQGISASPRALQCIAFRESDYEPWAINGSGCLGRHEGYNSDEGPMKGWLSTAHGLSQHVKSTIEILWDGDDKQWQGLKSYKVKGTKETYESKFKTPGALYDALWFDPELHLELMAIHLKRLEMHHKDFPASQPGKNCERFSYKGNEEVLKKRAAARIRKCQITAGIRTNLVKQGYDDSTVAVYLAYDSDQARTWVNSVINCERCLGKGGDDYECLLLTKPKKDDG